MTLFCSMCHSGDDQIIEITRNVTGVLGEDVYLGCTYLGDSEIISAQWKRLSLSKVKFKILAGVLSDKLFSRDADISIPDSSTNLTVKMRVSSVEAEGEYICEFSSFEESFPDSMTLTVVGKTTYWWARYSFVHLLWNLGRSAAAQVQLLWHAWGHAYVKGNNIFIYLSNHSPAWCTNPGERRDHQWHRLPVGVLLCCRGQTHTSDQLAGQQPFSFRIPLYCGHEWNSSLRRHLHPEQHRPPPHSPPGGRQCDLRGPTSDPPSATTHHSAGGNLRYAHIHSVGISAVVKAGHIYIARERTVSRIVF